MLRTIPASLPTLSVLLDNIGASPRAVARALDVSESTVYRWIAKDQAPRGVMAALFFCSTWGRSAVHCEAENAASMYAGMVGCLLRERGDGARLFSMPREAANSGRWARSRPVLVRG